MSMVVSIEKRVLLRNILYSQSITKWFVITSKAVGILAKLEYCMRWKAYKRFMLEITYLLLKHIFI